MKRAIHFNLDGSCELYEALCAITRARNFLGTIPGIFLMTTLPSFGKSRFEIAFVYPKFDGSFQEREARNAIVSRDRWIDNLTSKAALRALRPGGKSFYNDDNMELYVRCISGQSRYVELETIGRPLWKNTWEEPSYDLPNAPKRRDQDHEDESTAAPKSIEQDRKIVPFRKKAVTFMFHATYGTQIKKITQQGIKPGRTSTPRGRQHVHMACIDDIIYDDQESDAALTHVPKGRDVDPCIHTRQPVQHPNHGRKNCPVRIHHRSMQHHRSIRYRWTASDAQPLDHEEESRP